MLHTLVGTELVCSIYCSFDYFKNKIEFVGWPILETLVYRCQATTLERKMMNVLPLFIVIAALLYLKDRIPLLLGELSSDSCVYYFYIFAIEHVTYKE